MRIAFTGKVTFESEFFMVSGIDVARMVPNVVEKTQNIRMVILIMSLSLMVSFFCSEAKDSSAKQWANNTLLSTDVFKGWVAVSDMGMYRRFMLAIMRNAVSIPILSSP